MARTVTQILELESTYLSLSALADATDDPEQEEFLRVQAAWAGKLEVAVASAILSGRPASFTFLSGLLTCVVIASKRSCYFSVEARGAQVACERTRGGHSRRLFCGRGVMAAAVAYLQEMAGEKFRPEELP